MEEQKLREKVAKWLFRRDTGATSDITWDYITTEVHLKYMADAEKAEEFLAEWAKANGYVKLAEDQNPPQINGWFPEKYSITELTDEGWQKVELPE